MITFVVYLVGGFIGIIYYFVFGAENLIISFAQFSILISFVYTFIGRLLPNVRNSLIEMVPSSIPFPKLVVYMTGVLELAIAIGVLFTLTQMIASIIGIILCVVLFPANIKAFKENIRLNGNPPTNIWLRLAVQLLFILSFLLILL